MIATAEALFGPYEWDRYDMLVLPPSFPYGGMENPRMTFLTPTLLAGDRSLVDVVAHELAHSWTGNLVTNAAMEHFWLNEGFTVWAERRILEALHGERAPRCWPGRSAQKALDESSSSASAPARRSTRLRTELAGIDPDDAFSSIPYEKGARFVGPARARPSGATRFDRFMRDYMRRFRFTSITTEEFLALPRGEAARRRRRRWTRRPGSTSRACPANAPVFRSPRARRARPRSAEGWAGGRAARRREQIAGLEPGRDCSSTSSTCRASSTRDGCAWLDAHLALTGTRQLRDPGRVAHHRRAARTTSRSSPRMREVLLRGRAA